MYNEQELIFFIIGLGLNFAYEFEVCFIWAWELAHE